MKPIKKNEKMLMMNKEAHFTSKSSKKNLPISWKLPSLCSEVASLTPNMNTITLKAIYTLQNINPPKESNQRRAFTSFAAIF